MKLQPRLKSKCADPRMAPTLTTTALPLARAGEGSTGRHVCGSEGKKPGLFARLKAGLTR